MRYTLEDWIDDDPKQFRICYWAATKVGLSALLKDPEDGIEPETKTKED